MKTLEQVLAERLLPAPLAGVLAKFARTDDEVTSLRSLTTAERGQLAGEKFAPALEEALRVLERQQKFEDESAKKDAAYFANKAAKRRKG